MADVSPSLPIPTVDQTRSRVSMKSGDWVQILSAREILATLDERGTLDGLPLMPEMLPFCGRNFRIGRMAGKACIQGEGVYIGRLKDCVVLQMQGRCGGESHGGCQMGCKFYWKTAWLKPTPPPNSTGMVEPEAANSEWLENCSQVDTDNGAPRFVCQATELVQIATPTSPFKVRQYIDDYRKDKIGIRQIVGFLFSLVKKKILKRTDNLAGPNMGRTPVESLNLEVGQRVRVKSLAQIRATLDVHGCNRGLWFDKDEMGPYCEKSLVVSRRIVKLIDEKTGELKVLKQPAIVLAESECSGVFRRFCSRGMLHFWREIWLERE